jgi:hypothetical protein
MAKCRFCGEEAGFWCDEHEACRKAKVCSISPEELKAREEAERAAAGPYQLTALKIFVAVFLALCAYGIVSGIVGAMIAESNHTEEHRTY